MVADVGDFDGGIEGKPGEIVVVLLLSRLNDLLDVYGYIYLDFYREYNGPVQ